MTKRLILGALLLISLTGCAIQQTVTPVTAFTEKEVCIVKNDAVRQGFLSALNQSLTARGYRVRELPQGTSLEQCPVTTTYTANWRWDLRMYMAYADISVYRNGKPAGKATYDSTRGGSNFGKFIEADKKIQELVGQLFPPAS
jgi:uncharacterized lipoprotein YajG